MICSNFVWLITLNCLVFEKQQQIKRKFSAGEKTCFREEEQKRREGITNMATYMIILFTICFFRAQWQLFELTLLVTALKGLQRNQSSLYHTKLDYIRYKETS